LLLSANVLGDVGLPNPGLTLYEDDTEFTWRIVSRGHSLAVVPRSKIDDSEEKWTGDESGRGPEKLLQAASHHEYRFYYSVRNRALFDYGRAVSARRRLRYAVNKIVFMLYLILVAGQSRETRVAFFQFLRAVHDGERAKLGLGPPLPS
jgi:GT2 family glycosyltransferase